MLFCPDFMLCSAFMVFSGYRLSRLGDIIAEKTAWGGPSAAVLSHGTEMRSLGRVECQPRPMSVSEAMMKVFQKITKKKNSHE